MVYTFYGDKMKKRIKKVIIFCFLSIICGSICGKLVYGIYDKEIDSHLYGEKIYLIQAGSYSNYDNMIENTSLSNYIYYKDEDGLFKSIIGLTENYDNIEKIKSTYDKDVIISEFYSNDDMLNQKIKEFDHKMNQTTDTKEIQKIVLEMLNLYKDNKQTLTEITS